MRNHNDGMWTAVGWEGFFYSLNVRAQRAAKPSAAAKGWAARLGAKSSTSSLPLCTSEYTDSEATASNERSGKRGHGWEIGMHYISTRKPDDCADDSACGDAWRTDEKLKHGNVLLNVQVRGVGPASPARRPSGEAAPRLEC